jgi:hypothetical protein
MIIIVYYSAVWAILNYIRGTENIRKPGPWQRPGYELQGRGFETR